MVPTFVICLDQKFLQASQPSINILQIQLQELSEDSILKRHDRNFSRPNWLDSLHPAYGYLFFVLHQLVLLYFCHHDQAHCFFILNDHHMPIPNSFTVATCTLGRAYDYLSHIIILFVCLFQWTSEVVNLIFTIIMIKLGRAHDYFSLMIILFVCFNGCHKLYVSKIFAIFLIKPIVSFY